jgi:surface protein
VSSVKDMGWMFHDAAAFNQPLDKWDVSSVKDMNCMFHDAAAFNQPSTLRHLCLVIPDPLLLPEPPPPPPRPSLPPLLRQVYGCEGLAGR